MTDKKKSQSILPDTPIALAVDDVKKNFALPHEKSQSVKGAFTSLIRPKNRTVEVQHALKGISFNIHKGEFFGIVGRNGSGKSTMLKILAGIYQPSEGRVRVEGKLVPFIELGVGFNPELTGRENVFLNGALLGFSRKEIEKQYSQIVAFAELEAFMDQKLKNYSSGMQVRLAFSVAIIADADILLVDEVLAVGDADFQRKCFQYFRALKKSKKTVVFVSHDMNAVREYCDRAVLINKGHLTIEGDPNDVANEYLKLFNESSDSKKDSNSPENRNRWGNESVVFKKIHADADQENVHISAVVHANKDADDVVVGFRLKEGNGRILTGSNTLHNDGKPFAIKAGQTREMSWTLPNIFGTDMYAIDATIRLSDGVTICDNWDEAVQFAVTRPIITSYPVSPDIAFDIKDAS